MRKNKRKISHAQMNNRLEEFIRSFVNNLGDEAVSMNKIDTATRIFVDALTPLERGMLLYEGAVPIEPSQLSPSDYDYYSNKYGAENMEKGCFLRLPSGKTSFISHEHNLKYKVGN
jgi:hypothetical protein